MIQDEGSFLACLQDLKQAMDDGRILQANVGRARVASKSLLTCDPKLLEGTSRAAASLVRYNAGMIKYFDGLVATDPAIGRELKAKEEGQSECSLKRASVQELKCLAKPPSGVDKVVAAFALLTGMVEDEPDWKCCQKLMANPKEFVLQVEALGRDKAPDEKALWEVRKMVAAQEFFTVEEMGKKSMAAACIAQKVLQVLAEADVVAAAAAA